MVQAVVAVIVVAVVARAVVVAAATLTGCGLGDPVTAAAVGGAVKAKELEQARQTKDRVIQQFDAADRAARARLEQAEAANP